MLLKKNNKRYKFVQKKAPSDEYRSNDLYVPYRFQYKRLTLKMLKVLKESICRRNKVRSLNQSILISIEI